MGDALDANGMLGRFAAAVVAGIFAERSFQRKGLRVGRDKSFEDDLRGRRNQQIAQFAFDQFHRRAAQRSCHFIFGIINRRRCREKQASGPNR